MSDASDGDQGHRPWAASVPSDRAPGLNRYRPLSRRGPPYDGQETRSKGPRLRRPAWRRGRPLGLIGDALARADQDSAGRQPETAG